MGHPPVSVLSYIKPGTPQGIRQGLRYETVCTSRIILYGLTWRCYWVAEVSSVITLRWRNKMRQRVQLACHVIQTGTGTSLWLICCFRLKKSGGNSFVITVNIRVNSQRYCWNAVLCCAWRLADNSRQYNTIFVFGNVVMNPLKCCLYNTCNTCFKIRNSLPPLPTGVI
jgi:hypothetical protein